MASLSKQDVIQRIFLEKEFDKRLIISPILNPNIQIGESSIDIRLGFSFLKTSREHITHIDALSERLSMNIESSYGKIIGYPFWTEKRIILHPGDFILGSTIEYVKIPKDIIALISGRSSWARLGLIIHATGGIIHPQFSGTITFELANVSSIPIILYPGIRIAQLIFIEIDDDIKDYKDMMKQDFKESRYFRSLGPSISKIFEDEEISKLRRIYKSQE